MVRAYAWLGEGLTRALGRLGWAARAIAPDEARRDNAALRADERPGATALRRTCFGGRSPYEVLVAGRKVVGLCQVRRRAGTLYQVGILLGFDAAAPRRPPAWATGRACSGRCPARPSRGRPPHAAEGATRAGDIPEQRRVGRTHAGTARSDCSVCSAVSRQRIGPWPEEIIRSVEQAIAETAPAGLAVSR